MDRNNYHQAVLDEILEERVVSSRGRYNLRVVKQKMKKWLVKPWHEDFIASPKKTIIRIIIVK